MKCDKCKKTRKHLKFMIKEYQARLNEDDTNIVAAVGLNICKELKDVLKRKKQFDLFVNSEKVGSYETEDEVWDRIDKTSSGSLYEVRDSVTGFVLEDFIPF